MPWGYVAGAAVSWGLNEVTKDDPSISNQSSATPEQQAALKALLARLQGGNGVTPFGGSFEGATPGMEHSLAALEEWSKQMMANRAGMQGSANSFLGAQPENTDIEDVFKNSIQNPLEKEFNDVTSPGISKKFGGSSIFGSDAREADTKARSNLMSTLVGAKSKLKFDTMESAKNRALQKNALGVDLTKAGIGADSEIGKLLGAIFGGQGVIHDTNMGANDRTYAEFVRQQGQGQTNISNILAALGLNPNNTVVTPGTPGLVTSAAPGIGQGVTQAMMNRWLSSSGSTPAPTPDPGPM